MSIKFSCPHCKKALNVKDNWAGKKAQCPGCKQVVAIPYPVAQPAVDAEALALSTFGEEEKAAPAQPGEKIQFQCPMCDEKISVNAELEGKQAPCPECRRIVKVPLQVKAKAKDWRQSETRLPAGARREDMKGMEDTWGTVNASQVSRQALLEAKAIVLKKEKLTWQQWTKRSLAVAGTVGTLALATWMVLHFTSTSRQGKAFNRAMTYVAEGNNKLTPNLAAEVHRLAGLYYLKADKADLARSQFQSARERITKVESESLSGHDLMLIDLAVAQVGLGGGKAEVIGGVRLDWDKVQDHLRQTLTKLKSLEAKREAMHAVSRVLIARGEGLRAVALAGIFPEDKPELEAVAGLELLRADKKTEAEAAANSAQQGSTPSPAPSAPPPPSAPAQPAPVPGVPDQAPKPPAAPPVPPALIALWYALDQPAKARVKAPAVSDGPVALAAYQLGTIQGFAYLAKWPQVQALVKDLATNALKVQGLVDAAEIAVDAKQLEDAKPLLEEAAKLAEAEQGKEISPWTLWRLARLSAKAGLTEAATATARIIVDPALRQQAFVDMLPPSTPADDVGKALGETVDRNSTAYALALYAASRNQASHGAAGPLAKAIETWEPEKVRPFGYLGLALGLQEHNQ